MKLFELFYLIILLIGNINHFLYVKVHKSEKKTISLKVASLILPKSPLNLTISFGDSFISSYIP